MNMLDYLRVFYTDYGEILEDYGCLCYSMCIVYREHTK